jgi:hypothetical protein
MKTTLSPGRWRQIAIACFDYYVSTRLTEPSWIVTNDGIDKRDLGCFAKSIKCDAVKLRSIIVSSLIRTDKNCNPSMNEVQEDGEVEEITILSVSEKDEEEIMKTAIKLDIKESVVSFINVKRKLGKMPQILNHRNSDLKTTAQELSSFIIPLYKEAIEEVLSFDKE